MLFIDGNRVGVTKYIQVVSGELVCAIASLSIEINPTLDKYVLKPD